MTDILKNHATIYDRWEAIWGEIHAIVDSPDFSDQKKRRKVWVLLGVAHRLSREMGDYIENADSLALDTPND